MRVKCILNAPYFCDLFCKFELKMRSGPGSGSAYSSLKDILRGCEPRQAWSNIPEGFSRCCRGGRGKTSSACRPRTRSRSRPARTLAGRPFATSRSGARSCSSRTRGA